MLESRLIHRVEPCLHEDVVGFFMRVAEKNHLSGPKAIPEYVLGTGYTTVGVAHLSKLASYTRTYIQELHQLSGIEKRLPGGSRSWQIDGEWVTKTSFVSARKVKICPACLYEAPYIRGIWALSFYTACAHHELQMIDRCPACNKALKWDRRSPASCGCGFNLANAKSIRASTNAIVLSQLLSRFGNPNIFIRKGVLPAQEMDQLVELSMDGLCKTIWFLGHSLSELGQYGTGHGRFQPRGPKAEVMIGRAFDLLSGWPTSLMDLLVLVLRRYCTEGNGLHIERLLRPVNNYLVEELQTQELRFMTIAYEQALQTIWRVSGLPGRRQLNERQSSFEF